MMSNLAIKELKAPHYPGGFLFNKPTKNDQEQPKSTPTRYPFPTSPDLKMQESMQRVFDHRQKLVDQLEKSAFDLDKYRRFYNVFKETLEDALRLQNENTAKKQLKKLTLSSTNDRLIVELLCRKRQLYLIRGMLSVRDAVASIESTYKTTKNDVKKFNPDTIRADLAALRCANFYFMQWLNTFLHLEMKRNSRLFHALYNYAHECIFGKVFTLTEEIFQATFVQVKWPHITLEAYGEPSAPHLIIFFDALRFLLEIETGQFCLENTKIKQNRLQELDLFQAKPSNNKFKSNIAIKLMVLPFVKRFQFYFINAISKLNSLENPEWYLCQVEQWITRNEKFLVDHIDPILTEYFGDTLKSAKLIKTKLELDAPHLDEDALFTRTLDEVITFNKQIAFIEPTLFEDYPFLNPMSVLLESRNNFDRFIQMERDRLNEVLEGIFESETSWEVVYGNDELGENKLIICEAADKFALLLQNLIERSTFLPTFGDRINILSLIFEIMDDFRLRISQLAHDYDESWPFSQKFYSILNTFHFLVTYIADWNNNEYVNSLFASEEADKQEIKPENLTKAFQHMIESIFDRIESVIFADVNSKLVDYIEQKWQSMSVNLEKLEISEPGVRLFYTISSKLGQLKRYTAKPLFDVLLYQVANTIQDMFFSRVILGNRFNRDGVAQLQYDIQFGLFATFSFEIKNIAYTFSKLSDALIILNFNPITVLKLKERATENSELEMKVYLKQLGIYSLQPSTVMSVAEKRIGFY